MQTYPGTPAMAWLTEVPTCVVNACLRMLPIFDCEARIAQVQAIQIGTGTMPAEQASPMLDAWNGVAFPRLETFRKPDPTILAQHGIPVRRVKKKRSVA